VTTQIFPEHLDGSDTTSEAELKLYQAFKDQLPDSFTVFHGVSWLGKRRNGGRPADGETDFIIAHKTLGILVLEVKGGLVGRAGGGEWYSIRRDGRKVSIKNPFDQAKINKYALIEKLKEIPNWPGRIPTIEHAVAFPDGVIDQENIGLEAPAAIIMQMHHLTAVQNWVRECLDYWRKGGGTFVPLQEAGAEALKHLLARSWQLRPPRLGEQIAIESARIEQYTKDQFALLRQLDGQDRAAIRGCAGSGKTVLAINKARQLASEGFQVLLTCYNRRLAEKLRRINTGRPRLKVYDFHELCQLYAERTGYARTPEWDSRHADFFEIIMPQALLEAAANGNAEYRFDAIIVDEGQDFSTEWLTALDLLLRDPNRGVFYIFYDDNQLLYERDMDFPVTTVSRALTANCRNTQHIHQAVTRYYLSDLFLQSHGPSGRNIEIELWPDQPDEQRALLVNVLASLVHVEEISPSDIVVLGPYQMSHPPFSTLPSMNTFHLVPESAHGEKEVLCTSVRLFKGLESPVVVLVMPDDTGMLEEMMYVGLSRAQNHVIVLAGKDTVQRLGDLTE
jgi:hypothetical protein